MPDGDRFERTLYGRGWRKAYRFACADGSFGHLGDTLITAVAAVLRGPLLCGSMNKVRDAVFNALKEKAFAGQLNFGDQPLADPFRMLCDLLGDIEDEDANSVSTQLATKVAKSVYLDLQRDCAEITSEQVQERLAEAFGEQVVRNQFLARVREGIAIKNNRSPEEQMVWEEDLFKHLSGRLRKMVEQMLRADGRVAVRAPRRTMPKRKMTIEELHQGIAILEV